MRICFPDWIVQIYLIFMIVCSSKLVISINCFSKKYLGKPIPVRISRLTMSGTKDNQEFTISNQLEYQETIKKSKFIVFCKPIRSMQAGKQFIESISDPKATHNCWAMKCSNDEYRVNDDGEPAGTAGRPILSAIESLQLRNVVVVVTRYFGGIKLGTGGLIRAYASVARNALSQEEKKHLILYEPKQTIEIQCSYFYLNALYELIHSMNSSYLVSMELKDTMEASDGQSMVNLQMTFPILYINQIKNSIQNICKGQAIIQDIVEE